MTRILVADNYPLSRLGVALTLKDAFKKTVVLEASNSKEVYGLLKRNPFHLLIIAISQPGKNAIDLLKNVKAKYPKLPVLILCIYPESLYAYRALRMGASGYISRESSSADLIKAASKLLEGGSYVSSALAENMVSKLNKKVNISSHELLSDRELQVLQLMALGKTAKTIANEVNLSVSTIGTYRQRILNKLDLKTNGELTRFAIENALV